jgi:hypothetical protein
MENQNLEINVKKVVKESLKIKIDDDRKIYLLNHNICPTCLIPDLVKSGSDTYCQKCGTIWNDYEIYQTHGFTSADGDKKEIYTPPTNLRSKAQISRMYIKGENMTQKNKQKFWRLSKQQHWTDSSFAKNHQAYLNINQIIIALSSSGHAIQNKKLIEDVALSIYAQIKNSKKYWEKINMESVIYLTFIMMGMKLNMKDLYEVTGKDEKQNFNKFKRMINKSVEKIFQIIPEEKRISIKKHMVKQILTSSGINVGDDTSNKVYDIANKIILAYPNMSMYHATKYIIYRKVYNGNPRKLKMLNEMMRVIKTNISGKKYANMEVVNGDVDAAIHKIIKKEAKNKNLTKNSPQNQYEYIKPYVNQIKKIFEKMYKSGKIETKTEKAIESINDTIIKKLYSKKYKPVKLFNDDLNKIIDKENLRLERNTIIYDE